LLHEQSPFLNIQKLCFGDQEIATKTITDVRVVATSLIVSISDVALNLAVSIITGSTVMLSQALQGLSDLVTGGILYLGVKRSKKKADLKYQFGYGREIFFWVLMAGIVMFVGTGGMSVYFGYKQFTNPGVITNIWLAFGMLTIGLVTNLYAFSLSLRRLHNIDPKKSWYHQLLHSSIVETKVTLLVDFLGSAAAVLGFIALFTFALTDNVQFDGLGSMAVGTCMMLVSILLIRDVRDLIVGKSVEPEITERIIGAVQTVDGILSVLDLRTMYLGSGRILVMVEVHVEDGLYTDQIEAVIDNVKLSVQKNIPQVHHIQVEVETPDKEIVERLHK
jgi:cation diffusion facilitator family transporter